MKTDAKSLPNLKEAANRTKSPIQITSAKSKPSSVSVKPIFSKYPRKYSESLTFAWQPYV